MAWFLQVDGTKGAYEVGAWKALKELNVNVTAIVGASIGAINGALILQDDFAKLQELYDTIQINNIINVKDDVDPNKNIFNVKNIVKIARDFTQQRGFTNEPLKKMMDKYIDIDKIYESETDFGIITYDFKEKKPLEVFKKDIPKKEMIHYLLASSCFPIYKSQKIGDSEYIDGGFYDNIPINMLVKRGYKNIIVVDISGIGLKRKLVDKNIYIKMIKTNEDLGGTFDFNKEKMRRNEELGYLDTLRAFNKLQGHLYYFPTIEFNKLLNIFNLKYIYGLEYAAKIYKIEYIKKYSADEFLEILTLKHKEAWEKYKEFRKDLDLRKILMERKHLKRIISRGLGLCFVQDLFRNNSTFKNSKIIGKLFYDYVTAADALVELENYQ